MELLARIREVFAADRPLVEPADFALFYEQTHAVVFRYAYMLHGGGHADVEDCAAEAYARAWRHRHKFSGDQEAALGWIITIARRIVIDQQRRQRSFWAASAKQQPATAASPEQEALLREREQLALDLLAQVPLAQRDLLIMRYFLGWRVQAIASHLGRSEGAVSVSLHRALRALQARHPGVGEGLFHGA
ncbi:MAG TPA: sigma-70 family RNA polymerase sigma factor [Herpetosiphonaceae bacterium]